MWRRRRSTRDFYEADRWSWLDQIPRDVRGSFRLWRKLAAAASFIVVVGLIGCGLPALAVSRIDAARALRDE